MSGPRSIARRFPTATSDVRRVSPTAHRSRDFREGRALAILTEPQSRPRRTGRHSLVIEEKLLLDCAVDLGPFTIAYQTYGTLNPERSNAILICHA